MARLRPITVRRPRRSSVGLRTDTAAAIAPAQLYTSTGCRDGPHGSNIPLDTAGGFEVFSYDFTMVEGSPFGEGTVAMRWVLPWFAWQSIALGGLLAPVGLADDFRIETEIFIGNEEKPAVENLTLFYDGRVYDFLLTEPAEITVGSSARSRPSPRPEGARRNW